MQYPRILKSPNLTRVFGSWQENEGNTWQERVSEVFGMTISLNVEKTYSGEAATCTINPLEWQVLEELSNILRNSRSNWKYWTVELVEKAIPKLVKACVWKNGILSEQTYLRDVVNEYAETGVELLSGLSEYFDRYSRDGRPSTRKHLVRKYLEAPYMDGDSTAILKRALRCFVTLRINRKLRGELIFKFCPDLTLSLRSQTFDKYLYEQLCLYIYLFRNAEEAHFFLERRQQLINFTSARLPDDHEDLAETIVGETFDYLIKRRNCYNKMPENVWIDTSLDTYFIGNILSSKRIQRFWEKRRRIEDANNWSDHDLSEDFNDDNISVKPKRTDASAGKQKYATGDSERDRLLRRYIDQLSPVCKSYFLWEFFGISPAKDSQIDTRQGSSMEKPCLKNIRDLLVSNGYYDLFVK
jgi:hypothetical protein